MNNPLQQYIELYDSMAPAINAHAPHVLNARRTDAAGFLRHSRLPRRGDQGYVYSSPEEMFAPDLGVNINRVPFRGDLAAALRTDVPLVSAVPLLVTNDHIDPAQPIFDRLPEGLTVCPMSQAEDKCPGLLERYYARLARTEYDAAVALTPCSPRTVSSSMWPAAVTSAARCRLSICCRPPLRCSPSDVCS